MRALSQEQTAGSIPEPSLTELALALILQTLQTITTTTAIVT